MTDFRIHGHILYCQIMVSYVSMLLCTYDFTIDNYNEELVVVSDYG